eukprot:6760122-Prymnesium_polylepis.1
MHIASAIIASATDASTTSLVNAGCEPTSACRAATAAAAASERMRNVVGDEGRSAEQPVGER